MSEPLQLGALSPAALDLILRRIIRAMRHAALGVIKEHDDGHQDIGTERTPDYGGVPDADVRTRADTVSQLVACDMLDLLLPGWGRIGEENRLRIACRLPHGLEVTIDPLDGSEHLDNLLKDQSVPRQNVCLMLSVRHNGDVVAAYIMSLFNGILFRVAPGDTVVRVSDDGDWEEEILDPVSPPSLAESMLVFHRSAAVHPKLNGLLAAARGTVFGRHEEYQGSIGGDLLQVVMGKAAAMARRPRFQTPWDDSPMALFCRVAGVRVFEIRPTGLYEVPLVVPDIDPIRMEYGLLYVGGRYVDELASKLPVTQLG